MSAAALANPNPRAHSAPTSAYTVTLVLAAWLAAVLVLGANHFYMAPPRSPPLALLISVLAPMAIFVAALRYSASFRAFALALDPRFTLGLQAWRFAGFAFLALMAHRVLPGYFALPAGLGDMAIGLTAPWLIVAISRRPESEAGRGYVIWNLLGILDLVVAVGVGGIGSFLLSANAGADAVTTASMAELPMLLIPVYLVPIFAMLHIVALARARQLR